MLSKPILNEQDLLSKVLVQSEAVSDSLHYKDHPKEYGELIFKQLWHKQVEIMESVRDNEITLVKSGNDVGKTAIAAITVMWLLDCWRPYVKIVSTAKSYSALQYMLWSRIRSVYGQVKDRFGNAKINYLDFKPDPDMYPEWFAVGYNPEIKADEAESFQGHHAPPAPPGVEGILLFVIDEMITIHPAILKAIEGSLFSEGTKLFGIYNPTDPNSVVKNMESDPRANVIQISQYDLFNSPEYEANPEYFAGLANPEKTKNFVKIYGKNSPIVKARVLGEFPDDDESSTIPLSVCEEVAGRYTDDLDLELERIIYSWDVAGEGSDLNVLRELRVGSLNGEKIVVGKKISQWHSSHKDSLLRVNEVLDNRPDVDTQLIVDAIGEGSHVPSIMGEWQPEVRTIPFKAGNKAKKIVEQPEVELLNTISEAWYRTSLLFRGETWDITPIIDMSIDLKAQLSSRKKNWSMKAKEPLVWFIEPKKDWSKRNRGTSPDDADALVMGVWGYFHSQAVRFFAI